LVVVWYIQAKLPPTVFVYPAASSRAKNCAGVKSVDAKKAAALAARSDNKETFVFIAAEIEAAS
jgi:hypothetical protein